MQKMKRYLMVAALVIPGLILAKKHHMIHFHHHKKIHRKHSEAKLKPVQTTVKNSDLKFSGYVETSYNYLHPSNQFSSGAFNRVYDIRENGAALQQINVTLAYQPKNGFGGLINPLIGRDAFIVAPYGWDANVASHTTGFALPQAFLQYARGSWTWMVGQFLSLAGAESVNAHNNTNFSRSILYGFAEPFTVTGVRASYIPNDKLSFFAGLNNGWDNIRDRSRHKTLELGVNYVVNPILSLAAYGYSGQQRMLDRTATGPLEQRNLVDLIATVHVNDQLSLIANYDYGKQENNNWQGIAGYVNYQFNPKWRTSLRGEFFNDHNGYRTGIQQKWREATFTVGYTPVKHFELRAEARRDFSDRSVFLSKNAVDLAKNQQSYALEMIYQF